MTSSTPISSPSFTAHSYVEDERLSFNEYIQRMAAQILLYGAGIGVIRYGVVLSLKKIFPLYWEKIPKNGLSFCPYLFNGFLTICVWKSIKLIYLIALRFLKNRPETLDSLKGETRSDRLYLYSWKVIFYLEEIHKKMDEKFSYLFGIPTLEEIREKNMQNEHLHSLAIFRQVCIDHVQNQLRLESFPWSLVLSEFKGFIPSGDRFLNAARLLAFNIIVGKFLTHLNDKLKLPDPELAQKG